LKKTKTKIYSLRNEMDPQPVWARSDEEKAAMFAEYLATVYTPHDDHNDNEKEGHYLKTEVQTEIACLNPRKAPGIDGVTPIMLKEVSRKGLVLLTHIFTAILKQKYLSNQLRTA
jgi:hypothetical protein